MDRDIALSVFASAIVTYYVSLVLYRLFFHPLALFPGPKIAAISRWYEAYYDVALKGQYTRKIEDLHRSYGMAWHSFVQMPEIFQYSDSMSNSRSLKVQSSGSVLTNFMSMTRHSSGYYIAWTAAGTSTHGRTMHSVPNLPRFLVQVCTLIRGRSASNGRVDSQIMISIRSIAVP